LNFALPTAAIILALIPGIVFRNIYLSGKFSRRVLPAAPVTELAEYFVIAVPLDIAGLFLFKSLGVELISFESVIRIFTGQFSEESTTRIAGEMRSHWNTLACIYVIRLVAAGLLGWSLQRFVWALRLDIRFRHLRMKSDWYYALQDRQLHLPRLVIPHADIMVDHAGETLLLRGVVTGFEITQNAEIRELHLENVRRGKDRGDDFKWIRVPTDHYIVMGNTILTINMHYFTVKPPHFFFERQRWRAKQICRAFFFAEP